MSSEFKVRYVAYLIGVIPLNLIALFNHAVYWPKSIALIILLAGMHIVLTFISFRAYQYASATILTMMYSLTPVFVSLMAMTLPKGNHDSDSIT